jgi:hypothetical protein
MLLAEQNNPTNVNPAANDLSLLYAPLVREGRMDKVGGGGGEKRGGA